MALRWDIPWGWGDTQSLLSLLCSHYLPFLSLSFFNQDIWQGSALEHQFGDFTAKFPPDRHPPMSQQRCPQGGIFTRIPWTPHRHRRCPGGLRLGLGWAELGPSKNPNPHLRPS